MESKVHPLQMLGICLLKSSRKKQSNYFFIFKLEVWLLLSRLVKISKRMVLSL